MARKPRPIHFPPAAEPVAPARMQRRKLGGHTIHDVAALAGVSSITVSRFFNQPEKVSPSLRERITQAVQQTGYVPSQVAGRLASGRGRVVGAVMQNFASATFADTVQGMSDVLDDAGLQLLLANTNYVRAREEKAIRSLVGWHPSALILTRPDHSPVAEALLRRLQIPIVETWDLGHRRPFHQVGFSHEAVGAELALHFITQGARRIRFAQARVPEDFRARQRALGYTRAMREHGLVPDVAVSESREPFEAGAAVMAAFAAEPASTRPQAIVFTNDDMAAGAILHAPRLGLQLPRDCAMTGFGDAPLAAHLHPTLTSMRPDRHAIGRMAAQLLVELLAAGEDAEPAAPRRIVVPCTMVLRDSGRIVATV
jgi:LacI family gluconate utilization system Gnt-I transcriptional repressor